MSDVSSLPVEHLFTLRATLERAEASRIPDAPPGARYIVPVSRGTFDGVKLRGTLVGPSGDWLTIRSNNVGLLDVRLVLVTDDGARILMTYSGIVDPTTRSIRTAPLFQAGDPRYVWLNDVQAVGIGFGAEDGSYVQYEVYRLL